MVNRILLIGLPLVVTIAGLAFSAPTGTLQDPLQPVNYQAPRQVERPEKQQQKAPEWKLSAVLSSENRTVAVIDGNSCQEGDLLDGYQVMKIENGKVHLKNHLRKIVLRRAGTGLKKVSSVQDVGIGSHP